MVGRMLAGQKKTAAEITARTKLRGDGVDLAVAQPLAPGSRQALIAQGWDDTLNGAAGIEARRKNNAELDAAFAAGEAARNAFDADPSPANAEKKAAAERRYDKAVAVHDDQPNEFDAERLQTRVDQEFDKAP